MKQCDYHDNEFLPTCLLCSSGLLTNLPQPSLGWLVQTKGESLNHRTVLVLHGLVYRVKLTHLIHKGLHTVFKPHGKALWV